MKKESNTKYGIILILGIIAAIVIIKLITHCPVCDDNMNSLNKCIDNRDFYMNEYVFCSRDLKQCLIESVEVETKPNSIERAEYNSEDCKSVLMTFNRGCLKCGNETYCKPNTATPMYKCEYYGEYEPVTWQTLTAKNQTLFRCDFKGDSIMVKK